MYIGTCTKVIKLFMDKLYVARILRIIGFVKLCYVTGAGYDPKQQAAAKFIDCYEHFIISMLILTEVFFVHSYSHCMLPYDEKF